MDWSKNYRPISASKLVQFGRSLSGPQFFVHYHSFGRFWTSWVYLRWTVHFHPGRFTFDLIWKCNFSWAEISNISIHDFSSRLCPILLLVCLFIQICIAFEKSRFFWLNRNQLRKLTSTFFRVKTLFKSPNSSENHGPMKMPDGRSEFIGPCCKPGATLAGSQSLWQGSLDGIYQALRGKTGLKFPWILGF